MKMPATEETRAICGTTKACSSLFTKQLEYKDSLLTLKGHLLKHVKLQI